MSFLHSQLGNICAALLTCWTIDDADAFGGHTLTPEYVLVLPPRQFQTPGYRGISVYSMYVGASDGFTQEESQRVSFFLQHSTFHD